MAGIAGHVRAEAMAYLQPPYRIGEMFFIGLTLRFVGLADGLHLQNAWVPFAFITAGFSSGLAGFFGMKTAT